VPIAYVETRTRLQKIARQFQAAGGQRTFLVDPSEFVEPLFERPHRHLRGLPSFGRPDFVRTKWLVAADAVEEVDYNLDDLTKVWTQTNAQDQSLAEGAYRGICSGGYMPGPLADEEYLVKQFLSWYAINSQKHRGTDAKDCNHRSRHRWLFIGRRAYRTRVL
jgi:Phenylpropionate dioxygenase and related ring-hydroxylating dioxygenases, large terminal subunit